MSIWRVLLKPIFGFSFWNVVGPAALGAVLGRKAAKEGASIDDRSYRRRDAYDWEMGQKRGLTAQEYYGSPASGGSASSGAGAVLGNSSNTAITTASNAIQKDLDRKTIERGQDAQVEIANIQAGVQTRGQDIDERLRQGELDLKTNTYERVTLPMAAAELRISEQRLNVLLNEVVTSSPSFVKQKILLQMGVENTIQTVILKKHKVDPTDQATIDRLSEKEYKYLLAQLFAAGSRFNREIEGISGLAKKKLDELNQFMQDSTRYQRPPSSGSPNSNWIPGLGAPG